MYEIDLLEFRQAGWGDAAISGHAVVVGLAGPSAFAGRNVAVMGQTLDVALARQSERARL